MPILFVSPDVIIVKYPKTVLALAVVLMAVTVPLYMRLPVTLVPTEDRGILITGCSLPSGLSASEFKRYQTELEKIFQKNQYVDSFFDFAYGDYLVIPRGTIYQVHFTDSNNRLFIVESFSPIRYPKKYVSKYGQLMEHSPYCERDIRGPQNLQTFDEKGDFLIRAKKKGMLYGLHYGTHPFDVVGWDGCCYPYVFSIHDFEPITGRVHQPPPVHQTFEAQNFVVCSFVPRLYDYHPQAIPAPYNHSNIDSDELLYYVDGDFMSRKNVTRGMITLHPAGIPHGPHPGAVKKSIGAKETKELAVMVDTFHPLMITKEALEIENGDYVMSWAE